MFKKLVQSVSIIAFSLLVLLILKTKNIEFDPYKHAAETLKTTKPFEQLIAELRPVLMSLSHQKFFKYFRVDVSKECPFWEENPQCPTGGLCTLKCRCDPESMPKSWLEEDLKTREKMAFSTFTSFASPDPFRPSQIVPDDWNFDYVGKQTLYADLTKDREAYTGYQGQRVWNSLYSVQCAEVANQCGADNPIFHILSGMHTSVSSHLSEYFVEFLKTKELMYPNDRMYYEKVGAHPDRMQNLVLAVHVMLRALVRATPSLTAYNIDSEDAEDDAKTRALLAQLASILSSEADVPFDSHELFKVVKKSGEREKENKIGVYLNFFRNVTQMMDCVDCQKCKVYGKMQVLGLGVGIKTLIRDTPLHFTRNELVAFLNTINKWTESIEIIGRMQQRIMGKKVIKIVLALLAELAFLWLLGRFGAGPKNACGHGKEHAECAQKEELANEKKEAVREVKRKRG